MSLWDSVSTSSTTNDTIATQQMDDIEYQIHGHDMQLVELVLDSQEAAIGEAGSMLYLEDGIVMETLFGDGSAQQSSFMQKLLGAGKRLITGESLFTTAYTNQAYEKRKVAFAAPYPGQIMPINLRQWGGELVCQKDAFLCAAKGVSLGIALQKRLGAGFFGGEGFIMQRLEGDGWAFIHACGATLSRQLAPSETLRVDTGCLVALSREVDYDIEYVGGIKTALLGGEGLFFARLRGPVMVILQSLPFNRLASRIFAAAPRRQGGGGQQEESSWFNFDRD